ncbi:unnamed protein product [Caenorhabditis auriculariae]|uniref:Galectin domain-containing protein n=1 Tax=Caenorhabditis auriculariae TaxID=2777116 RepID=A0A8S1HJD8_9PELO|nr:unnamed protein product [Caenorhabditis auriculariae]
MMFESWVVENANIPCTIPVPEGSLETKNYARLEIFGRTVKGEQEGSFSLSFTSMKKATQPFLLALRVGMYHADTTIILNHLQDGKWNKEKKYHNFIRIGEPLHLVIDICKKNYTVYANGRLVEEYPIKVEKKLINGITLMGDVSAQKISYRNFGDIKPEPIVTGSLAMTPTSPTGSTNSFSLLPAPQTPPPRPPASSKAPGELPEILSSNQQEITEVSKILLEAASKGDLDKVTELLESGADVDSKDFVGATPIYWASEKGHLEVVRLLLDHEADVEIANKDGWTPLLSASFYGKEEIVTTLLRHGADPNAQNGRGFTALQLAAFRNHPGIARILLEYGAEMNHNKPGWNALHIASKEGHTDVVKEMLENGADISEPDVNGFTPLHQALQKNHTEVVRYLIDQGAQVNARNKAKETPLHIACQGGNLAPIEILVENEAKLDEQDIRGNTPLIYATFFNYTEILRYLISVGANVKLANKNGTTALHIAAAKGYMPIVELLVKNGSDVNAVDTHGNTPFLEAVANNSVQVARYLLNTQANHTISNKKNETALEIAQKNSFGMMEETIRAAQMKEAVGISFDKDDATFLGLPMKQFFYACLILLLAFFAVFLLRRSCSSKLKGHDVQDDRIPLETINSGTGSYVRFVVDDHESTILKLSQTPPPASPKPSYADVLRYDILVATKEAQSAPLRESSFVIHNLVNEKKDEKIVEEICQLSSVEKAQEIFRLGKSTTPPPPLRVHLQNKDAVVKVLKNFNELKGKIPSLRTASVQRDMSKTELEKHRTAWKEAVRRNDAAASRIWTVRDFEVVKLRLPAGVERHPWSVRSQEPKAKL